MESPCIPYHGAGKGKALSVHAVKAYGRNRGVTPLVHQMETSGRLTFRSLCRRYPLSRRLGPKDSSDVLAERKVWCRCW
jgi:hypothetical protein